MDSESSGEKDKSFSKPPWLRSMKNRQGRFEQVRACNMQNSDKNLESENLDSVFMREATVRK
ncbi:hypothetical protein DWY73_18015 [Bacteroides fragilis]|uniref:Uncharacterized protein n=3 Tax=Bacteroides fragilis TaxID=817 RepID=Q5LFP6_BACFN|nr:hypothetical protein HMPREF0101_00346 [Bacteroides fragilis]EYA51787.1 hypothetical protein M114_3275 [Bacteroides fragilis str. 3986 N(B)22]CAH07047.1 hypothetical protein BF9343_1266 [Bacteroides fragilis NCTC 9343]KAA4742989.1 hypothetical protein F3B36_09375 [Bacteroides fragilis]KAA4760214.1 hypothetical protein F3B47_12585 [Bacteroides fragilis]